MKFLDFIQLMLRNFKWVVVFPILTGLLVWFGTRHLPHTWSSEMVIYTGIASGYNLDNDMEGKVDYHEANSKFDNLINTITAGETLKEVAIRLLADRMQHPGELTSLVNTSSAGLNWLLDSANVLSKRISSVEDLTNYLSDQIASGETNVYYRLLFGPEETIFSVSSLNGVKASRMGFSDMVKVEYTSSDPMLTKRTLDILGEVFLRKYKGMRIGEVNNVVKYFEEQTAGSLDRLQTAENKLKQFRISNRVINYSEQTKYIADQKEDYDQRESQLKMDLSGYQQSLANIVRKLDNRSRLQLQSEHVMELRNELSENYNALGLASVRGDSSAGQLAGTIESLRSNLKTQVADLYGMSNSVEGIPGKSLLDQWLELTVHLEESKAKLAVLETVKNDFEKTYDHFAPMGSDLSRLERDVDVYEKEYLNLLHNLGQAKLRERNLVVTENISVIDPPDLPVIPNSSKRLLLVIAAFFATFLASVLVLVLKEYLDDSLSNPMRVQQLTGLRVATAFSKRVSDESLNIDKLDALSYNRWKMSVLPVVKDSTGDADEIAALPVHSSKTDYNELLKGLSERMKSEGKPFLTRHHAEGNESMMFHSEQLLMNSEALRKTKLILLFMNAALKIDPYSMELIARWKESGIPVMAVLVNTKPYHLEPFLGELPRKRSAIRRRIKDIVRRYSR